MKVLNFSYDGFFGRLGSGFAPYEAEFKKWSGDPGIAVCECSDGKERLIASFALKGFKAEDHLAPELSEVQLEIRDAFLILPGVPCKS